MVKTFLKNLLLRNQKAYDIETWYVASGAGVTDKFVQMMTLGWPYGKIKFGPLCFCMGKS